MKLTGYAKFAWIVLLYNLFVILWGAYVRATGSGAGCGSHWPLCNGEVLPRAPQIETIIEYTHRLSSGIAFILVLVMFLWALRAYPKRHLVRLGASLSMILITTEALVGAGLVLFEWVAHDASVGRAVSIVIHLINTFLLLAALSLNAWWASGGKPFNLRGNRLSTWLFLIGIFGTMVIGASGALTALGDTLFPVNSFVEGITQDFSPTAHFLLRLRLLHPTIAVIVGIYLLVFSGYIRMRKPTQSTQYLAYALSLFLLVQLAAGLINVLLLAPVWMQIVHLLLADGVWIILIILTASSMAEEENIILHLDSSEKIQGLTNQ
jgi:heme A synthase